MNTQNTPLPWKALRQACGALAFGLLTAMACLPAAAQTISTVAGDGAWGSSNGDGGPATSAQVTNPTCVAVDSAGNLYITDVLSNRVRKVSVVGGIITTIAGDGGPRGFSGDGDLATSAELAGPNGVAVDSVGNLYISDAANHRIRMVNPSGTITTIAGNGIQGFSGDGGAAISAELGNVRGIAVDSAGNLYLADAVNHRIRKVSTSGTITTVAGDGTPAFGGDGNLATSAQLNNPIGITVDNAGNLYIADGNNYRIRKVSPSGTITTVAGNGIQGFSGDGGPATSAKLTTPDSVAVDSVGNLYIADSVGNRIRKVSPSGTITTMAGDGTWGFSGDGGPAASAQLSYPGYVAADNVGNLYIADGNNNRIRKITATVPDAPTSPSATAGNAQATVTWTAPADTGSSPITSYIVTASDGVHTCTATAPATTCTVAGLTNGTAYTFTVVAVSAAGNSVPSAPSNNSVTPMGSLPSTPASVPTLSQWALMLLALGMGTLAALRWQRARG